MTVRLTMDCDNAPCPKMTAVPNREHLPVGWIATHEPSVEEWFEPPTLKHFCSIDCLSTHRWHVAAAKAEAEAADAAALKEARA